MIIKDIPVTKVFHKIGHFIFGEQKWKIATLGFIIILTGLTTSIDSILIQKLIDQIESYSSQNNNDFFTSLFKYILLYALWWESLNILWRTYDYVYLKTIPDIKANVTEELYDYVQYHSHGFFQKNLAGDLTSRITDGARSFEMIFAHLNEKILRKFSVITFALITMYSVHYKISVIFLTWILVFVGISLYFSKNINIYSVKYNRDKARVSGKIVDSISNIFAIRMFTSYNFEQNYIRSQIDKSVLSSKNMQWFMLKLRYCLGLSCTIMITTIIYYIITLKGSGVITIGQCVLIITLCVAVGEDMWDLTQEFGDLFEEIGAFGQTMSLFEKHTIIDKPNAKVLKIKEPSIEFKNVTFFYHNNKNIFNKKSVKIEAYQKIGLAGFSGSGKTTFTNLITRLFDIESGEIVIDGQNIAEVTQDSLRQNLSIIPQEPILFHRTIFENIRYGNKIASYEDVIQAAKLAYIDDDISQLPDRYDTICGERGNNLSGGQRQRIIIARAILKNAPILILDEATSSLDTHTENLIQKSLQNLMKNKTILVIAHRLSTLLDMDRILVFDSGYIIEDGTHEALKTNGKLYQKLWDAQKNGSLAELY